MSPVFEAVLIPSSELVLTRARLAGWMGRVVALLKGLGPYAAIELLLPGGSVIALLLWLYRRSRKAAAHA